MDKRRPFDKDLDAKVKKTSEKISENMHIVANEPSLAFYRIQEHVRKILPVIVDRQADVHGLQQDLQGHCYDLEYSLGSIKSLSNTKDSFSHIHELLKNAIFLKQQLKYEEQRQAKREANNNSMYKRLSSHIPIEVMRETASRVENIVGRTTTNNNNPSQPAPPAEALQKANTSMY